MTIDEIAGRCCREVGTVRTLQKGLWLHVPGDGVYSEAYCRFVEKVVALHALHVSRAAVAELFEKEKQILRLLHVDSVGDSPTWYLDACALPDGRRWQETRLLLSGYDLGFPLDASAVQDTLDFGASEKELFKGGEMGEDVRKLLADYVKKLTAIRKTVRAEVPAIRNALGWAGKISWQ